MNTLQERTKAFLGRPIPDDLDYVPDSLTERFLIQYAENGCLTLDSETAELLLLIVRENKAHPQQYKPGAHAYMAESREILEQILNGEMKRTSWPMRSRLYYHRTNVEVELGDRVLLKRFLRKSIRGTVCYIPGISQIHSELEFEDVSQWAIRASNGCVYPILYDPANFQPPKRIVFLERGHTELLDSAERLK